MFGSTTLSLPPPFAIDHHALRVSSEPSRPQPSGGCNFLLVQPSAKSKICACQVYHHNRSAPGNVCDCGHPACFHIHTFGEKSADGSQGLKVDPSDKIRKLEETILAERQAREADRVEWQRETRALRDALAPFYRIEDDLQRRLAQMDAKLQVTAEQQRHLDEVVKKFDGINVIQHRIIDTLQNGPITGARSLPSISQAGDEVPGLTSSDERSSASSFSRHQTPSETTLTVMEPDSPRSSGILNLASHSRPIGAPNNYNAPRSVSQVQEEPRSSGFLGVDMKRRSSSQSGRKRQRSSPRSLTVTDVTEYGLGGSRGSKSPRYELPPLRSGSSTQGLSPTISPQEGTPPRSLPRPSPTTRSYSGLDRNYAGAPLLSPHQPSKFNSAAGAVSGIPFMALDVLANLSTATNGI